MLWTDCILAALAAGAVFASPIRAPQRDVSSRSIEKREAYSIAPKVFIFSMFQPEADVWHGISEFDLLARNITVPGFSPEFPDAHCTEDFEICQLVTGEGEINAAVTIASLVFSPVFDLRSTYILIAGIDGMNPKVATIAAVTFARYEVQAALQYEFDSRDLPENFTTGYIPQGSYLPGQYPRHIYGTEVFELNVDLRDRAMALVDEANVTFADNDAARGYRAKFEPAGEEFAPATKAPGIVACDGVTADTYFSGTTLVESFQNYTKLVTKGQGNFCGGGQEDSASFEALIRGAAAGRNDFSRIIAMRTGSDFLSPPPGVSEYQNLKYKPHASYDAAIANLVVAGLPIVQGIIKGWDETFEAGITPSNYVGDILGTIKSAHQRDIGISEASDTMMAHKQDSLLLQKSANDRSGMRKDWSNMELKRTLMPRMSIN